MQEEKRIDFRIKIGGKKLSYQANSSNYKEQLKTHMAMLQIPMVNYPRILEEIEKKFKSHQLSLSLNSLSLQQPQSQGFTDKSDFSEGSSSLQINPGKPCSQFSCKQQQTKQRASQAGQHSLALTKMRDQAKMPQVLESFDGQQIYSFADQNVDKASFSKFQNEQKQLVQKRENNLEELIINTFQSQTSSFNKPGQAINKQQQMINKSQSKSSDKAQKQIKQLTSQANLQSKTKAIIPSVLESLDGQQIYSFADQKKNQSAVSDNSFGNYSNIHCKYKHQLTEEKEKDKVPSFKLDLRKKANFSKFLEEQKQFLQKRNRNLDDLRKNIFQSQTSSIIKEKESFEFRKPREANSFMKPRQAIDEQQYMKKLGITFQPNVTHGEVYKKIARKIDRQDQALAQVIRQRTEVSLAQSKRQKGKSKLGAPVFRV